MIRQGYRTSKPAPHARFVPEIFLSELSLQVTLLTGNGIVADYYDYDWQEYQRPENIEPERQSHIQESKAHVYGVSGESVGTIRDESSTRLDREWACASTPEANKAPHSQDCRNTCKKECYDLSNTLRKYVNRKEFLQQEADNEHCGIDQRRRDPHAGAEMVKRGFINTG